jgi:hypothetical protein
MNLAEMLGNGRLQGRQERGGGRMGRGMGSMMGMMGMEMGSMMGMGGPRSKRSTKHHIWSTVTWTNIFFKKKHISFFYPYIEKYF